MCSADVMSKVKLRRQIQQSDRIIGVDGFEGVGAALMDKVGSHLSEHLPFKHGRRSEMQARR